MRLSLLLPVLMAFCAALAAPPAAAWGRPAHRVVAALAEARLRPAARAQVARLLAGQPLATVSNWADEQREAGGEAAARSKRWHYVDFRGGGCDYVPARDCRNGDCVVAAIDREFQVLADTRRSDAERAEALRYLVHFVADVHEPMHSSPVPDHGGLDYQVSIHGKGRSLHYVWDGMILDRALDAQRLDEAGYVAMLQQRPSLPPDPMHRSDHPALDWALESCRLVREGSLYPAGHVLGDDYLDAHQAQAELRLRLAGARLADMLNAALDPRAPVQP